MPKRKRTRSSVKSRSFKKRRIYKVRRAYRNIPRSLVGDSRVVRFTYVDQIAMDPATGALAHYSFRANSMYDVDYTGVGHTSPGVAHMFELFQECMVLGSKLTAQGLNYQGLSSANQVYLLGQTSATVTAPANDLANYMEQRKGKYALCASSNTGRSVGRIRLRYSPRKLWDIKDPKDLFGLRHTSTTNPTHVAFFHLGCGAFSAVADPAQIFVNVRMDFICRFSKRLPQAET